MNLNETRYLSMCDANSASLNASAELLSSLKFYGQGVAVLIMSVFGIVGNTLAIITIASMSRISLFYKLLIALAISDVMFILTGGLFILQTAFRFDLPIYYRLFPSIIYPIAGISMTGSTYACLAIAAERYFGICFLNHDSCYRKFRMYAVAIALSCIVIDTPRFFEVQTVFHNETGVAVGVEYTDLRKDSIYIMAYFMWFRLIATIALPFTLMLYFNIKVFVYYKRTSFHRHHSKQEKSLMIIFTCITVTFFMCHLPRAVLNIYEFQLQSNNAMCRQINATQFIPPAWFIASSSVEKMLLILNASANFVYYCFSGREFRNRFVQILFCKRNQSFQGHPGDEMTRISRCQNLSQGQCAAYESIMLEAMNTMDNIEAIREEHNSLQRAKSSPESNQKTRLQEDENIIQNFDEPEVISSVSSASGDDNQSQLKVICVHFLGQIYGDQRPELMI